MTELQASYDFCVDVARREARNFYYSFLVLPPGRRRSMCALYAFLRRTDDLADAPGQAGDKAEALAGWRVSLDRALVGRADAWPGLLALADTVRRHEIPPSYLHEVLDGVEMDLAPRPFETFDAWLRRHGQDRGTIDRYWATVLVSALNERLDRMDVGHARKVFLDGFLRNRDGYQMEIPLAPLGEIYGTRLETWLAGRGIEVRLTTGVRSVETDTEGHLVGLKLRDGEIVTADFVLLAAPFDRVPALLPDALRGRLPSLERVESIEASPITGIHLWFDRPVCPHDHVATVGRLVHWVFNHSAIQGRAGLAGSGQYLQVVISASYDLLPLDKVAIRDAVLADLASIWPAAREATLLRWWVVTEHGATFAVRPGIDADRPAQRTPVDGLFLAGDWTSTGWPATMEGAVRSGYLAAEGILADLGRPDRLVRPGLPAGRLARWLLGPGSDDGHSSRPELGYRPIVRPAVPIARPEVTAPGAS